MLIAIMGDTFDRVSELRLQSAAREKINMINDHIWLVQFNSNFKIII